MHGVGFEFGLRVDFGGSLGGGFEDGLVREVDGRGGESVARRGALVDLARGGVDGVEVAGFKGGGGVGSADDGGQAQLAGDDGCVADLAADVGDDGTGFFDRREKVWGKGGGN